MRSKFGVPRVMHLRPHRRIDVADDAQRPQSTRPKKIAFFLQDLFGGGAERVMLTLAGGFADRGYDVDLILVRAEGPRLADVPPNVRIVALGTRRTAFSASPDTSAASGRTRCCRRSCTSTLLRSWPRASPAAAHA